MTRRRKPTIEERAQLVRAAIEYIDHYRGQSSEMSAYDLAYRGLGKIAWLHPQSRDGIAAMAATGTNPYDALTASELQDLEDERTLQSMQSRWAAKRPHGPGASR